MGNKTGKCCIDGNVYSFEDFDEYVVVTVEQSASSDLLEESVDSGYVDVPSAAPSRESSPEPGQQCQPEVKGQSKTERSRPAAANQEEESKLGQHHAYFGYRHYHYDCVECEGNRHITNDDL